MSPDNAIHVAMVNELVPEVWSNDDKTALVAKATETVSRATVLGLGVVKVGNVVHARAM